MIIRLCIDIRTPPIQSQEQTSKVKFFAFVVDLLYAVVDCREILLYPTTVDVQVVHRLLTLANLICFRALYDLNLNEDNN